MPIPLTIQGVTYNYPSSGEDPNWAEDQIAWTVAVTDILNTLVGAGDILQTTATINNNQVSAINVSGLLFDPSQVRAANIIYSIYRTSTANPSGFAETGIIYLIYDNNGSIGSKWLLAQQTDGISEIVFSITDLGQLQYRSSDISSIGYLGIMRFSAKTLEA